MKAKKLLIGVSILIGFICLCAAVFYGTYYFFINKSSNSYVKTVSAYINDINKVNSSEKSFLDENGKPSSSSMNEFISALTKIQDNIENLIPTEIHRKDNNNLLNGLENNILLYKQINSIASNPTGSDVEASLENLKNYRDKCANYYSLVDIPNISITLPKETMDLIISIEDYVNENLKLAKEQQIKTEQQLEFINNLEVIIKQFIAVKNNYVVNVSLERSGSKDYDKIIKEISSSQSNVSKMKKDLSNISVPQDGKNSFAELKKAIEAYEVYLVQVKYAVSTEKVQINAGELTLEQINSIYENSDSKYKNVENYYTKFSKTFNQYKISTQK